MGQKISVLVSRLICVLIFASAGFACQTAAVHGIEEKRDPVEGMVFLTFVMRTDSIAGKTVELTRKTIVQQKLKSDPQNSKSPNRIWVSQLTNSGNKLSTVALDHPLFKRVEFANDQGSFESKELILQDAEFYARVTLYAQTAYIQVEEELQGKVTYSGKFKLRD